MLKDRRLQEFKKAILYLRRKERVRTNTDVAVAMNISPSYLSQILHGSKNYTDALFEKFESHFKINLKDPFTYADLDWISNVPDQKELLPGNSKALLNSIKKLFLLKDKETENQKQIIEAQQQLIKNLQQEINVLKPLLK